MTPHDQSAGFLRGLWRRIYWFPQDFRIFLAYQPKAARRILFFGGTGLGDELLLSTALHELRARNLGGLGVMTSRPEFFQNSPDVDEVFEMHYDHAHSLRRLGWKVNHLTYIERQDPPDIDVPGPGHILTEMCRRASISGEISLRPYIYLSDEERERQSPSRPRIVMQSSRRAASHRMQNKEWFPERFQMVADALLPDYEIVQLGMPDDPPIEGARDLRGATSLRESAAVLSGATLFVGLVGFLMHLARAVDCPSVIVYGGRERPDQSGYTANTNLYSPVPCAPCWRWNSCDHDHRCMREILPEPVIEAVRKMINAPSRPLGVEKAWIDPNNE